jgi:VWFA-related protein
MRQLALALIALVGILAAQGRPATEETDSPNFSVSVNLVKVPVSVFDERGNLVTNLRSADFRIWEDQAAQQIRSFGLDTNPVSVVMLVDTSMSEKTELKKIREAAEEFVDALEPGDQVSLVTFDDQVYQKVDWTGDMRKIRKALAKITPGLRTALYDAMYYAGHDQLKNVEGRKAVILLTDCLNNQSSVDFADAALTLVQSQASLYVVSKTAIVRQQAARERRVIMLNDIYKRLFGEDEDYIEEFFRRKEAEMTDLAERTGGRTFFPADYDQIKDVYGEVARELKSKYYLTYISNQKMLPNTYHRIAIEYFEPSSKVIYRKGYYYQPRKVIAPR